MNTKKRVIIGMELGHNASVALMIDGKIVNAISEEKFDNIKNSSTFPLKSIKWLLEENKLTPKDITAIAVSGIYVPLKDVILSSKVANKVGKKAKMTFKTKIWRELDYSLGKKSQLFRNFVMSARFKYTLSKTKKGKEILYSILNKKLGIRKEQVHFIPHHDSHAYASYYGLSQNRDNEKALIITMDGAGDHEFATISKVENNTIKRLSQTRWDHSIGFVYSKSTQFLGMKALEHEYKVMGLAPYAKDYYKETYEKIFKNIVKINKDLTFTSKFPFNRFDVHLEKTAQYERFDNIAAALQSFTENITKKWVEMIIKKYKISNLYLGGGVFMNVKLNKIIQEMPQVKQVNFLGSCGDESNAIGSAYGLFKKLYSAKDIQPLENFYLGVEYSNEEVEKYIKKNKLDKKYKVSKIKDIEKEIAKIIAKGGIVARFKGKNEWGARALGNRTILGDPSKMESFYTVNDQIKMRDFWMPFAPSILIEDHEKYINNPRKYKAPFMITGFDSTAEGQDKLRAAMHQGDKTLRPQLVEKEINPTYHKLITEFKKLTGISSVLNTSMNLHGYPLVATLDQAMFTLENSGLENLAIENFLIQKK